MLANFFVLGKRGTYIHVAWKNLLKKIFQNWVYSVSPFFIVLGHLPNVVKGNANSGWKITFSIPKIIPWAYAGNVRLSLARSFSLSTYISISPEPFVENIERKEDEWKFEKEKKSNEMLFEIYARLREKGMRGASVPVREEN